MALSTQDAQAYQQAVSAYINGSYEAAAAITVALIQSHSDDPNLRLLLGHIYCCLQHHEMAREHYQTVLELTSDPELVECTNKSLREINQFDLQEVEVSEVPSSSLEARSSSSNVFGATPFLELEPENLNTKNSNSSSFDSDRLDLAIEPNQAQSDPVIVDPFSSKPASLLNTEASASNEGAQTPVDVYSKSHPVDVYDDLGELPDFGLTENSSSQSNHESALTSNTEIDLSQLGSKANLFAVQNEAESSKASEYQSSASHSQTTSTLAESQLIEPQSEVGHGVFARLENTSLKTKQLLAAIATGIISVLAVMTVSQLTPRTTEQQENTALSRLAESGLVAAVAGVVSGVTSFTLGRMTTKRIERATDNLQAKFDAVIQGDFKPRATIYSQDEWGQLAASFNQMMDVINQKTSEANPKVDEQEIVNEDFSSSDLTQ